MALLDFDEFLECCARWASTSTAPSRRWRRRTPVQGFIQNLLRREVGRMRWFSTRRTSTPIATTPKETKLLKGESQEDLDKWLDCWARMEIMDVHLWPTWEKEVHDILHPLFKELQLHLPRVHTLHLGGLGRGRDGDVDGRVPRLCRRRRPRDQKVQVRVR